MSKIIDVITYAGDREQELFEIRYNILAPFVDEFRVIEFDKTFSGKSKIEYMKGSLTEHPILKFPFVDDNGEEYKKVSRYMVPENVWGKYWEEAKKSPNTNYGEGAKHWQREYAMKESIRDCLTDLDDGDIIYLGDVDEIYQPFIVSDNLIFKLKLRVYTYWLNNKSSEEFWGTIIGKYKNIKGKCLNHLRKNDSKKTETGWGDYGWHFTSIGGYDKVKEKLTDSYTEDSYATKSVLDNLEDNIKNNRDFLGRDFTYKIDESELPKYILENKERYKHLFK